MKKLAKLIAFAGALTPALALAQTNVAVYGRIATSIDHIDRGAAGVSTQMVSNASRLGFRGVEDLDNGLKAVFGAEFGIDTDNGALSSSVNAFRTTYVGLTGPFGAVAMGRLDTANPAGSPLYSQTSPYVVMQDAGATATGTNLYGQTNRVSNAIAYKTPDFSGFNLAARYQQTGPDTPNAAAGLGVVNEGDGKAMQLALNYKNGPLSGGIGYERNSARATPDPSANFMNNRWQVIAAYDFKVLKAWAFYSKRNHGAPTPASTARDEVNIAVTGVSIPFGKHTVSALAGQRDVQTDKAGKYKRYEVGYIYSLSPRTKLYAVYDYTNANSNPKVANAVTRTPSVGIQHNF